MQLKVDIPGVATNCIISLRDLFEFKEQEIGCTRLVPKFIGDYGYITRIGNVNGIPSGESFVVGREDFPELFPYTMLTPYGLTLVLCKRAKEIELHNKVRDINVEFKEIHDFFDQFKY